jgi:hypothetical protein
MTPVPSAWLQEHAVEASLPGRTVRQEQVGFQLLEVAVPFKDPGNDVFVLIGFDGAGRVQ